MANRQCILTNATGARLAELDVSPVGDHFEGTLEADRLPDELRLLFAEFEETVEGQMFSLLDTVEDRIRAAGLRVQWPEGVSSPVTDLQVFPSTGAVSFRAAAPVGVPSNGPQVRPTAVDQPRSPLA